MRVLGIHFEGKKVKIALLTKVKNKLTIERLEEEIPYDLLKEKNLRVVTGLSAEDVVRREVSLKLTRESALLKALPFQLESLLPFSLEETVVHPFFFPQKEKTDAVVFATTRLALKKHIAFLLEKKIFPDQISCAPVALAKWVRWTLPGQNSWIDQNTAIALDGDKIVFSQSLDDKARLEAYLKNKFGYETPDQRPSTAEFAIPIGLALDGLGDGLDCKPCQFMQADFISAREMKKRRLLFRGFLAASLGLSLIVGGIGSFILYRKEAALREKISAHFEGSGSLELLMEEWQKKLAKDGQEFPLKPDVPSVSDVLAWLGTLSQPIELIRLHYSLDQYPKAGDSKLSYNVQVELEFTAETPAIAHHFQETIEKSPTLVDKKQKVLWTPEKNSYKISFALRKS